MADRETEEGLLLSVGCAEFGCCCCCRLKDDRGEREGSPARENRRRGRKGREGQGREMDRKKKKKTRK